MRLYGSGDGPRNAAGLVRRTRWTLATCWRYGRGERWRVALSLPWILAGRVAGAAGMALEEFRAAVFARQVRSGALTQAAARPYRTAGGRPPPAGRAPCVRA
jgi:hypothetical protein